MLVLPRRTQAVQTKQMNNSYIQHPSLLGALHYGCLFASCGNVGAYALQCVSTVKDMHIIREFYKE